MIKRIHWTDAEWLAVARELYRQHPIDQYLRSTTLASLTLRDFYDAQVVLPPERRRIKAVKTPVTVREGLLVAMQKVRKEIDAVVTEKEDPIAVAEAKAVETIISAEVKEAVKVNPYEAAFAPLIEILAQAVAARVQDIVLENLTAPTKPFVPTPEQKPVSAIAAPPVAPQVKERRLKFGVVGLLPVQSNEIEKAFPNIDFVCITADKLDRCVDKLTGCDKVIGMVDFMSHSSCNNLKKAFGENYHRTNGNSSRAKHLIGVLLNSMKKQPA